VVDEQADIEKLGKLPSIGIDLVRVILVLQESNGLIDAFIIKGNALAHGALGRKPVACLEPYFGLGAGFPEQSVVLVETFYQCLGNRLGDRILAGWNIHFFITYRSCCTAENSGKSG